MNIRKLKPEEYLAGDKLESLSFVYPVAEETEDKKDENGYEADRWGCFDESGTLSATLTNHDLPIFFDGGVAPSRGVAGVASDPVSRGQGHIRALMRHVLTLDRENGAVFSGLYPFSHPFYRKFGYELCFEYHKINFPMALLAEYRKDDPPQVRMLRSEDGLETLVPLYTAFAKQFNFAVARDARTWQRVKPGNPYKTEAYCYVLSRGGKDTGYVIFRFRPQEQPFIRTLCITDYAFCDIPAFYDLLRFLYRYAAQARDVEMFVPDTLPISTLLGKANDIKHSAGSHPMARAVHVEKALQAMRHPLADGEYTIYIEDTFLPDNEGCYRVRYTKDGEIAVSRCDCEADLWLSVGTFTQLALGFLNLKQAAFKPDVRISGNEAVLTQVFVNKPVFLWDFY